jgi:hypothetical protein
MPGRTLYYFAIGGTGAQSVEPLLHLCAAGLGPDRLSVILIDPDAGNPALGRALDLIDQYEHVRRSFGNPSNGFFRTELIRTDRQHSVWSPLGVGGSQATGEHTLDSYVQRARMDGESRDARELFDLLFSPAQQREKLKEGFRGNPAIGSIMMHGLKDATLFKELMNIAKNDTDARFFAVGSIFGGTGASALPVVAKLLADAGINTTQIGGTIVTPYYALGVPSADEDRDGRLKPESEKFLSATAAALPTYTRQQTRFGALYAIGDDQSLPKPRKQYSAGGPTQVNDPHFVEFFAALAALDFHINEREGLLYTSVESNEPSWLDLPLSEEQRQELRTFFVAANFYLQYFGVSRSAAEEQRLEAELAGMPFLKDVELPSSFVRANARELNELGQYFESVWAWLWTVTRNYHALRLVSFDSLSTTKLSIPSSFASNNQLAHLPYLESCLAGFNGKQSGGIFHRGVPDRLKGVVEVYSWYNRIKREGVHGMAGLLHYLRVGTARFVREWYSPSTEARPAS